MDTAVTLKIVFARKSARADGASKRFELRVRAKVSLEIVRAVLGKALVAVGIRALCDAIDVDACVHGVSKRVDHIRLMWVQAVVRHEGRRRGMHTVTERA